MIHCQECSLQKQTKVDFEYTNIIKGNGNDTANIMIIFDSLFYSDVKTHTIFSDDRYRVQLAKYLELAGLDIKQVYFTSLIKCYVADVKKKPTKTQLNKCFSLHLQTEIDTIKPKVIITIGSTVSKFFCPEVTNLSQAVGSYFYNNLFKCNCIPLFSLNYLSNLNPYAPQSKQVYRALQKAKYLLTKQSAHNFDFSYNSKYENLKTLQQVVSVDFETNCTDYRTGHIVTVGISDLKQNIVFDTDEIDWDKILPELKKRKIVGQNFIYDLLFAKAKGIDLDDCFLGDTRVMQFLLNRMGATSLGYMTQVYFGYGYKDEGDITKILEWTKEERKLRCVRDNYFQIRLFYKLLPLVKQQGSFVAFKILSQILPVIADMEYTGILIDKKMIDELIIGFTDDREKARETFIKKLKLPEDFNLNSSKQLREVMYQQLELPVKIKTKSGNESSNQKAIEIASRTKPVLNKLLEYRDAKGELEKLLLYRESIKEDGRIHSSFNTFSPRSSRAMSSRPNLQNVTRNSPLKNIFISKPGYSFLYYDFSALEFRLWAIISKDDNAIKFIKEGKDIHKYIASIFYKKTEEEVTKEERDSIKTVVYGSIYGADAEAVAYIANVDKQLAERVQQIFFQLCRKGYFWIKEMESKIAKDKFVTTIFGTTKYVQDLELAQDKQRKHLIDSAKNFIVQSTGGELGFIAMVKIHKAFRANGLDAHYVHNIHDGNIIEIKDEHLEKGLEIVKKYGNNPIQLSAPITIEIKVGKSWGVLESKQ